MKFDNEKCAMLIMKVWKIEIKEGIELPNKESNRTPKEGGNYNYLGVLKANTFKNAEK